MSRAARYHKLNLGPSPKVTARMSTVGMRVIADYLDEATAQRTLLLERPEFAVPPERPTTKKRRARRPKVNAQPAAESTQEERSGG